MLRLGACEVARQVGDGDLALRARLEVAQLHEPVGELVAADDREMRAGAAGASSCLPRRRLVRSAQPTRPAPRSSVAMRSRTMVSARVGAHDDGDGPGASASGRRPAPPAPGRPGRGRCRSRCPAWAGRRAARRARRSDHRRRAPAAGPARPADRARRPCVCSSRARARGAASGRGLTESAPRWSSRPSRCARQSSAEVRSMVGALAMSGAMRSSLESSSRSGLRSRRSRSSSGSAASWRRKCARRASM